MFNSKEYMKKYNKEYWRKNRIYLLKHQKEHRQENKEEISIYQKEYRQKNKEKTLEYNNEYHQKNREYASKYAKEYRQENIERILEYRKKNKEKLNIYTRKWSKTEKGKANKQRGHIARRVRENDTVNTLTAQEWIDILKQYKFKCAYCGKEFTLFDRETRDHIIPISKGGDNVKENIVPACRSCNSKKYNKIIEEVCINE
jgi:5-methylcytosine-specific restriction endonuclease McrA